MENVECAVGTIVDGVVSGMAKFGAFIDLPDGRRGLAHISEISETFVRDVRDFLDIGQTVKVYIMSSEGEKIRLSIKEASKQLGIKQVTNKNEFGNVSGGRQFETMLRHFLQDSDENIAALANRNDRRV